MEKVKFIYIGKGSRKLPDGNFYAMKLSKRDKEKKFGCNSDGIIYYPKTDNLSGDDELFIHGIGWKKFGKTNKVIIPTFSGNVEDWDEYLEKYGKYCLFYSLSGYSLDDMDCCSLNERREFLSLLQCNGGIVKYQKYVENFECIQEIQTKVFDEKLSFLSEYQKKCFVNENFFRPYFDEWMLVMSPYLNTPIDDVKMETFYRKYRYNEIKNEKTDFDSVKILEMINDEIDNGVSFPICMSDRMKMLFGEKCYNLYNYILKHFKE